MEKRKIQFISTPQFDEVERLQFEHLVNSVYDKISSHLNGDVTMVLSFKEYSKTGTRHEYEVSCTVKAAGIKIHAKKKGWLKLPTIRDCLNTIEKEVEKKIEKNLQKKRRTASSQKRKMV